MKPFPIWCDMCAKQNECHIADTVPKCYEPKQTEPSECSMSKVCKKPCKECGACEEECGMWKTLNSTDCSWK